MKFLSISCLTISLVLSSLLASVAHAAPTETVKQEKAEIRQLFSHYMKKYNHYLSTKEFNELPHLYDETIMVMSSSVEPYTIKATDFYQGTQKFLDNLQKKGVEQVGWIDINITMLDKNLALVSNKAARYLKSGKEYNRVGVTYLLRKRNNEWLITSFTVHNADGVVQFKS